MLTALSGGHATTTTTIDQQTKSAAVSGRADTSQEASLTGSKGGWRTTVSMIRLCGDTQWPIR